MVTVRIIYVNHFVNIKFPFDSKLVRMMKSFQAKYYSVSKVWSLPKDKVDELKEELFFNGYTVIEIGNESYKVIKEDATTN